MTVMKPRYDSQRRCSGGGWWPSFFAFLFIMVSLNGPADCSPIIVLGMGSVGFLWRMKLGCLPDDDGDEVQAEFLRVETECGYEGLWNLDGDED